MTSSASQSHRRAAYAAAFIAALTALSICAVTALGDNGRSTSILPKNADLLFTLTSGSGTFEKSKDGPKGTFELKLRDVDASTVFFTDRPQRDSGSIPTPRFLRQWQRLGFIADPPNAVVSLVDGADRADTVALELRRPKLSKSGSSLQFTVKLLNEASPGLQHLSDDLDGRLQRRFEDATLFIDDASIPSAPCTIGDVYYFAGGVFSRWEFPSLSPANGRLLSVEENPDLFALIGTRFGGDGQETFGLPTLDGPAPGIYPFVCTEKQGESNAETSCLVGEIRTTTDLSAAPTNWFPTDGRTLQVSAHPVLHSLIGNSFGGDGETTFALPTIEPPDGLSSQICYLGTFPQRNLKRSAVPGAAGRGGAVPEAAIIGNQYLAGLRLRAGDFPPVGTALAQGQLLSVSQNAAIFSLLGTTFGGNGKSTLALPDVPSPQGVPVGEAVLNWIFNLQGYYPQRD